ncbi:hypothetical protein ACEWPM_010760 [Roseovarius sp. S4756]|uniref:hypothetical protein n=1 Tax=Roseovarius maritimus TaxID=3342637 RepID=UPI0037298DE3
MIMPQRPVISSRALTDLRRKQSAFPWGWSGAVGRCRRAAYLFIAFTLCSIPAHASEDQQTTRNVVAICSNLGSDQQLVDTKLIDLGWEPEDTPETIGNILFWMFFARDFATLDDEALKVRSNSEDLGAQLGYLIVNSSFMAGSTLGNSALPPNQSVYSKGDYRLAVLGVSLAKGHCLVTGPANISETLPDLEDFSEQWPENLPKSDRDGVLARSGTIPEARIFLASLDEAPLRALYGSTTIQLPYTEREFDPRVFDDLPKAVIHISPIRPQ